MYNEFIHCIQLNITYFYFDNNIINIINHICVVPHIYF